MQYLQPTFRCSIYNLPKKKKKKKKKRAILTDTNVMKAYKQGVMIQVFKKMSPCWMKVCHRVSNIFKNEILNLILMIESLLSNNI